MNHTAVFITNTDLFLYFDALQIGLTATPRKRVSHNTYKMFQCDKLRIQPIVTNMRGRYRKVLWWILLPITVTTRFLREGIHSDQLSEEEKQRLEEEGIDPESLDIEAERLDSQTYNKDTNRKIL